MALSTQGVSSFSIDGIQYDVVDEITYSTNTVKQEYQKSLQGVENIVSYEPVPGEMDVTIRWISGVAPSILAGQEGATVNVICRNGTKIVAQNAIVVDAIKQDPTKLTSSVKFSALSITEYF